MKSVLATLMTLGAAVTVAALGHADPFSSELHIPNCGKYRVEKFRRIAANHKFEGRKKLADVYVPAKEAARVEWKSATEAPYTSVTCTGSDDSRYAGAVKRGWISLTVDAGTPSYVDGNGDVILGDSEVAATGHVFNGFESW